MILTGGRLTSPRYESTTHEVWVLAERHAFTLHAVALGLVSLDQGRELRLEDALRGVDLAQRADHLFLLQLVLDCQRQLRKPLEIRSRMELQLLELCEND